MSEDEARAWLEARHSTAKIQLLERFVTMLLEEAGRQSLIARSTFASVWARHIVDSAQLVLLAPGNGPWLDVGSGGGLPGLVIAILRDSPCTLSEPRARRVAFLKDAIARLGLSNARVEPRRVQDIMQRSAVISGRAVAALSDIFAWTDHCVSRETKYVLQRGAGYRSDMALAGKTWHAKFHVEHSITDPSSGIVVATEVVRR